MNDSDVLEFLGFLFFAYATGWGSGYALLVFKKIGDTL
jgi:hypothetical protein